MSFRKIAMYAALLSGMALSVQAAIAQGAPPPDPGMPPPPPPGAGAPPPGAPGAPPPAIVGSKVNLRQGPGTNYSVIMTIPPGAPVEVSGCNAGWCQVSFQGQNGFIIATSIAPPGGPGGPPPGAVAGGPVPVGPPPGYYPPPPYYYGGYYGPYGYYGGPYYGRGYYGGRRRW
jgi:hypothetical protein